MIFKALSRTPLLVFIVFSLLLIFAVLSVAQDSFIYQMIDMPLFFMRDLFNGSIVFSVIIGLLCHSAIVMLLYLIASELKLMNNPSFQIVIVYLLLLNVSNTSVYFSPALLSLLLVVLAIKFLLQLQVKHNANAPLLCSAALICISGLIYLPSVLFVIPAFITLIVLRPFSIRELVIFLIGIFLPLFYVFSLLYIGENLQQIPLSCDLDYKLFGRWEPTDMDTISLIFFSFLGLLAFIHIFSNSFKMVVRNRNFHKIWGLFLLVSISIYFFSEVGIPVVFLFSTPFLCIAIAYFITQLRKSWYLELAMLIVVVLSFILNLIA